MFAGIPIGDLAFLAVSLVLAGAVTGLLAGVFGVGGGAVIVPVLYEIFRVIGVAEEVRMPLSVGTSLAIIIPTSICSFNAHRAKGLVDLSILKVWAVPVIVGVLAGSWIARFAPADLFKIVFVVVATISALRLLFAADRWKFGEDMPGKPLMVAYGGIIGVLSALMGIGGGQLSSLFMTFYGRPIHQAVATSSGFGVLISILARSASSMPAGRRWPGHVAAAFARLCLADRHDPVHPDLDLDRPDRRQPRSSALQAPPRDRLRPVPAFRRQPLRLVAHPPRRPAMSETAIRLLRPEDHQALAALMVEMQGITACRARPRGDPAGLAALPAGVDILIAVKGEAVLGFARPAISIRVRA
jgi:uncharacterized membrane protein YfcA